jgi:hypothetical protein
MQAIFVEIPQVQYELYSEAIRQCAPRRVLKHLVAEPAHDTREDHGLGSITGSGVLAMILSALCGSKLG